MLASIALCFAASTVPATVASLPASLAITQDEKPKVELFRPTASAMAVGTTSVGMRVRIEELSIPGTDLRAKPVVDPGKADVIVRVINVFNHGSGRRYNIEVTPQIEGDIDLRDHLERADGSSMEDVPELRIAVDTVAPEDQLLPNDLEVPHPDGVGGYRELMIVGGLLWVLGLMALMFAGRSKKAAQLVGERAAPATLADRMRPLVERAGRGDLSSGERAELERLVLAHWRGTRDLDGVPVADAVTTLRADDEAGPLLIKLEEWFHRPETDELSESEVRELLAPYQNVPARQMVGGGAA